VAQEWVFTNSFLMLSDDDFYVQDLTKDCRPQLIVDGIEGNFSAFLSEKQIML